MPPLSADKVIERSNAADQEKQNWIQQYRDAYEFALPMRNLYETTQPGADKMNRVFNSVPITSTNKFASRLQANLTPAFQHWLDFSPGTGISPENKDKVKLILEDIQTKFFSLIQNSNFDTAITEYYLDLAVGTAAMLIMEGDDENPVIFTAVPNAQISLDEGPMGSIDGVFRQHIVAARNIEATWSDLTTAGKKEVKRIIALNNKAGKENNVNILEATYFDNKEKVFWYQVIIRGSDDASNISPPTQAQSLDTNSPVVIVERKLDESPWVITRWMKVAGETFGRGPLLFALPDIKTLNKVTELILQNASMAISGLWAFSGDDVANLDMVTLKAGTMLPVDHIDDIKRLDIPGDLSTGEALAQKLENNIRTALFDRSLPDPTGAVRSPTEIIERVRELAQDIGAPFSRINSEFMKPFAHRVLNIMMKKQLIDKVSLDRRAIKISPISPLAREQSLNDLQAAMELIQFTQSVDPQLPFGTLKIEDYPSFMAEKLGVAPELVRNKEERAALKEDIAQRTAAIIAEQQLKAQQTAA